MTTPNGMAFRIGPDGRLSYIPDPGPGGGSSGSANGLGDMTLVVSNAVGSPDAVAALVYAAGALPLPWTPSARFTLNYTALVNSPLGGVVRATVY